MNKLAESTRSLSSSKGDEEKDIIETTSSSIPKTCLPSSRRERGAECNTQDDSSLIESEIVIDSTYHTSNLGRKMASLNFRVTDHASKTEPSSPPSEPYENENQSYGDASLVASEIVTNNPDRSPLDMEVMNAGNPMQKASLRDLRFSYHEPTPVPPFASLESCDTNKDEGSTDSISNDDASIVSSELTFECNDPSLPDQKSKRTKKRWRRVSLRKLRCTDQEPTPVPPCTPSETHDHDEHEGDIESVINDDSSILTKGSRVSFANVMVREYEEVEHGWRYAGEEVVHSLDHFEDLRRDDRERRNDSVPSGNNGLIITVRYIKKATKRVLKIKRRRVRTVQSLFASKKKKK